MDMRTGEVYKTREAAVAAGVPLEALAEVEVAQGEIVHVMTGPFKGRVYERTGPSSTRRRIDVERNPSEA